MGNIQRFAAKYWIDGSVFLFSALLFLVFGYFPIWFSHFVFSSPLNTVLAVTCGLLVGSAPILFRKKALHWAVVTSIACVAIVGSIASIRPLSPVDREFSNLEEKAESGVEGASAVINRMEDIANQTSFWRYSGLVSMIYSTSVQDPEKAMKFAQAAYGNNHGAISTEAIACAYMANGKKDKALSFISNHPSTAIRSFYSVLFSVNKPCTSYGQRLPASKTE